MFQQIGSHVRAAVHFLGVSSLLSESVQMNMYIMRKLMRFREKSDIKINFCFGKTETSAQASAELRRAALLFLYPLESRKVADFLIVLQGK